MNISVKFTTIPQGLTAAATPAVRSKNRSIRDCLRQPVISSLLSVSGNVPKFAGLKSGFQIIHLGILIVKLGIVVSGAVAR